MSKITMIHEDGFGGTTTISQESEGGDMVQDHIETFLKFYDACGIKQSVPFTDFLNSHVEEHSTSKEDSPKLDEEYLFNLALDSIRRDAEEEDSKNSTDNLTWVTTHYYFGFPYEVES